MPARQRASPRPPAPPMRPPPLSPPPGLGFRATGGARARQRGTAAAAQRAPSPPARLVRTRPPPLPDTPAAPSGRRRARSRRPPRPGRPRPPGLPSSRLSPAHLRRRPPFPSVASLPIRPRRAPAHRGGLSGFAHRPPSAAHHPRRCLPGRAVLPRQPAALSHPPPPHTGLGCPIRLRRFPPFPHRLVVPPSRPPPPAALSPCAPRPSPALPHLPFIGVPSSSRRCHCFTGRFFVTPPTGRSHAPTPPLGHCFVLSHRYRPHLSHQPSPLSSLPGVHPVIRIAGTPPSFLLLLPVPSDISAAASREGGTFLSGSSATRLSLLSFLVVGRPAAAVPRLCGCCCV